MKASGSLSNVMEMSKSKCHVILRYPQERKFIWKTYLNISITRIGSIVALPKRFYDGQYSLKIHSKRRY